MSEARALERVWFGHGALASAARLALAPLELAYAGGMALRGALYDAGLLAAHVPPLPAVSVGNLTVGGTGKTPVAAWLAAELAARGAHPAIVLRGYGDDEPLVHRQLNPHVPVITSPDRLAGIARAAARGADLAVLDDAFQHRRARRVVDVVLVSADRWTERRRLLPAGPWREPLGALRRATLAVVTRKARGRDAAEAVRAALARVAPAVPCATLHLALGPLRCATGEDEEVPVAALAGEPVLAIAAVGDPGAFVAQLTEAGARVRLEAFPDHHRYTPIDAARLARAAAGGSRPVCTLKDAVKLAPHWPREAPPLWYVSQHIFVDSGRPAVDAALAVALGARVRHP